MNNVIRRSSQATDVKRKFTNRKGSRVPWQRIVMKGVMAMVMIIEFGDPVFKKHTNHRLLMVIYRGDEERTSGRDTGTEENEDHQFSSSSSFTNELFGSKESSVSSSSGLFNFISPILQSLFFSTYGSFRVGEEMYDEFRSKMQKKLSNMQNLEKDIKDMHKKLSNMQKYYFLDY
ncbi:hypothetical protein L1987_09845 [Smallanthus sonchifolius]|uniref:Uncharacterized protein n=1 Tax=Smallanthus sonchifolius TaxID=185202 RepID=A0ACB9JQS5_9ASTR|nr:hypothetical protein L1987_09845 [Smallanthus sonchifolius]